jgi:hypothetical protein
MLDQLLEISRKTVESSLQVQQVMFKQWTQFWPSMSPTTSGLSADWGGSMQKRWAEATIDALNKHRESLNASYTAGIQCLEQAFQLVDARSWDDWVHATEEIWRKSLAAFKERSETQVRDFEVWAKRMYEGPPRSTATSPSTHS